MSVTNSLDLYARMRICRGFNMSLDFLFTDNLKNLYWFIDLEYFAMLIFAIDCLNIYFNYALHFKTIYMRMSSAFMLLPLHLSLS